MFNLQPTEKPQPLAVSIEEAARLLSLSPHTIRAYERGGRIAGTRIGTRVLISMEEIRRVLNEGVSN